MPFTFEELLQIDNSFTIHHRNLQNLAIEMYKSKNKISPGITNNIFKERNMPHNLRNSNPYCASNIRTVNKGNEKVAYLQVKLQSRNKFAVTLMMCSDKSE